MANLVSPLRKATGTYNLAALGSWVQVGVGPDLFKPKNDKVMPDGESL